MYRVNSRLQAACGIRMGGGGGEGDRGRTFLIVEVCPVPCGIVVRSGGGGGTAAADERVWFDAVAAARRDCAQHRPSRSTSKPKNIETSNFSSTPKAWLSLFADLAIVRSKRAEQQTARPAQRIAIRDSMLHERGLVS